MSRVGILHAAEFIVEDTVEGLRDAAGSEAVLTADVDHVPENALAAGRGLSGVSVATHSIDRDVNKQNEPSTGGESCPAVGRRTEQ